MLTGNVDKCGRRPHSERKPWPATVHLRSSREIADGIPADFLAPYVDAVHICPHPSIERSPGGAA